MIDKVTEAERKLSGLCPFCLVNLSTTKLYDHAKGCKNYIPWSESEERAEIVAAIVNRSMEILRG